MEYVVYIALSMAYVNNYMFYSFFLVNPTENIDEEEEEEGGEIFIVDDLTD